MTPPEILKSMRDKYVEMYQKTEEMERLSEKVADAKMVYHIAYEKAMVELKIEGEPVTTRDKMARGRTAPLERDVICAEGVLSACKKRIEVLISGIDIDRSELSYLKSERIIDQYVPQT